MLQFSSVPSLSSVQLLAAPWTAACQASLSITNSRSCSDSCPLSWWCIQPSHPLLSPSPPAFNLSQHQDLFQWVSSSHQVAKVLEFQLQDQSFQFTVSKDLFPIHPFSWKDPSIHQASRATRPEHCGPTQSVKGCHHKEPLTLCTGFDPSQKACVSGPQILLCSWPSQVPTLFHSLLEQLKTLFCYQRRVLWPASKS